MKALWLMLLIIVICNQGRLTAQHESDSSSEREIFTVVEEQPSFEGGMDAFYKHLMSEVRYPALAREHGVEGKVKVQFDIERNGAVSSVRVVRDIGVGCGNEVASVVKKVTSFKPASQRGRTVKTTMVLPVTFKLDKTKTNPDGSSQGSIIIEELQMKKEKLQLTVQYYNGTWHGMLQDTNGKPLPGANIVVEGTNYGRVSGLDGTFEVTATASQQVVISYVGYESVRLPEEEQD